MLSVRNDNDLNRELAVTDDRYERLGEIGQDFLATMKAVRPVEHVNPEHEGVATYYGVGRTRLMNKIVYGPDALIDQNRLFAVRTHEMIHAFQVHIAAAAHADPYRHVALCPRDSIWLEHLKELSAYGGQLLFGTLSHYERKGISKNFNVRVRNLSEKDMESLSHLRDVMRDSALDAMNSEIDNINRWDYYADNALRRYEEAVEDRGDDWPVFVRLEPEDIRDIGNAFILNPFTDDNDNVLPQFMTPPSLPPELQERLDHLNRRLGLTHHEDIPLFGDVLKGQGLTRREFLDRSINSPPTSPPRRGPDIKLL